MHKTEYDILNLFKKNSAQELSTSEIIKEIFQKEAEEINNIINDEFSDKDKIKGAKQKNAKLHRQVLHHLNKLVKEDIISISKEGEKGEKFFIPNLAEGEELIIGKQKRKIVISKPSLPSTPIEGYEPDGIITKYESQTWVERINSLVVECQNFETIDSLYNLITSCFNVVNDAVALNNFEVISRKYTAEEINNFIELLTKECNDYGKNLSIIIDFTHPRDDKKLLSVMKNFYEKMNSEHIRFIFDLNSRELINNKEFFYKSVEIFSNAKANFYIKNQALHNAPYFLGAAGPYTFEEKEWILYKRELQENMKVVACSQAAIAVDLKRFFNKYKNISSLPDFMINIAEALLKVNSMQRTRSEDYFRNIFSLNKPFTKEFFMFSKTFIRLWNYGWKEKNIDSNYIIDAIKEAKKTVDTFSRSQETIYLSCGIPTRFKVAFSCAFKRFDEKILGGEAFHKIVIRKLEDFYSDELKNLLIEKEKIFEVFDGGDRIRFFRTGQITPQDIEREISILLNTYKLPFFCYDFGGVHGNLKLTNFIGE